MRSDYRMDSGETLTRGGNSMMMMEERNEVRDDLMKIWRGNEGLW